MSLNSYLNSESPKHIFPMKPGLQCTHSALTNNLSHLLEKVCIITVDGRTLTGSLVSCDQVTNLVLKDTIERIIRPAEDDEPSMEQPHGLYLVRGDNVVICGLVDEELDGSIDWTKVRGEVIGSTKHA
ncbi:hypothetical protein B0A55_05103 [Friedmanniomyces simplex]|uniref:LSM2-LSM8 complex subunit LSM8 n=1 Tax=Friedmanniomyces simplex TaxID=329884 RepID=A0A4U0WSL3_9PEZI|nr:hypothetical protein B0A55_13291 [Friedmanniomyces simplex]TKA65566.1 hypothetical protein B0A55_10436 [Friedmanniomyces simplex]TKA74697.1 hypothetical protein B0A55_05103 [Friedmanniomyces simplex]